MLTLAPRDGSADAGGEEASLIDRIVRDGARRMLAAALEAEVQVYVEAFAEERDERGRRLVVRNGRHQPREVMTSAGAVEVTAPRVNDRRTDPVSGERKRFASAILPAWCRRSPKVTEVLPLLYLHGLSGGDFVPALEQFLGSSAGLSAATVSRLTTVWTEDYKAFSERDLSDVDYVYVWADGIVRHEALHDRVEVEDLHRRAVVAAGQKLRAA
jgi:putative transposase